MDEEKPGYREPGKPVIGSPGHRENRIQRTLDIGKPRNRKT